MKLIEYIEKEKNNIQNYSLTEEMKVYTGTPQESVLISKVQPEYHSILSYSDNHLVTFFVLDGGEDKYLYTEKAQAMLLRSFSTDSRYLRQGHATKTLK